MRRSIGLRLSLPYPHLTNVSFDFSFILFAFIASNRNTTNGTCTLQRTVPDTITSWIISAFAINTVRGIGLTKTARRLKVFHPFFLSMNLPYAIKRGEILTVPIIVYNYLDVDVNASVVLHNHDNEFDFIDSDESIVENVAHKEAIAITSNNGTSVSFSIRPHRIGTISLKASVLSEYAGDSVLRVLNVESDGIPKFVNEALVSTSSNQNFRSIGMSFLPPTSHNRC